MCALPVCNNQLCVRRLVTTEGLMLLLVVIFFCISRFSFKDTKEWRNIYPSLSLPHSHKLWDTYLQLYIWDDHLLFLIRLNVIIRLLLNEIYHLWKLVFERKLIKCKCSTLPVQIVIRNTAQNMKEYGFSLTHILP